jgi:hypothetical protein
VDAGLPGVELEAHGQIAPTVGKTRRKPSKRPQSRENPAFSFRIVKFGGFLNLKSDRLLAAATAGKVLAVPVSAVIDSGTRQIVLVQVKEGRFEPREVKLGARGENQVEVRDGVREGEEVVVAANFLIDAESNLKAAVAGFGHAAPTVSQPSAPDDAATKAGPASTVHQAEGWRRSTRAAVSQASAMARWPASNGRR